MHQQYPISDLYAWMKDGTLVPNPEFQRRDTWPPSVKSYFIDTLLRGLPVPPIYIRTVTDPKTKRSYREVVDGQQRIRTITDYIDGKFALDSKANEYEGLAYEALSDDQQRELLGYQVPVEQLFEADTSVVLDIFQRLNQYGLSLNAQELRHGKYQDIRYKGVFRRAVIEGARRWVVLWDTYKVVSVRARVRMADDELMAQMFGVLLEGVQDGGQPRIKHLYEEYDSHIPDGTETRLDQVCRFLIDNFDVVLRTKLVGAPNFLMLFAATAHAVFGIPTGDMKPPRLSLPERDRDALSDLALATANLMYLADILDTSEDEIPEALKEFKVASTATTQRIRSRSIRFVKLYEALLPAQI